MVPEPPLEESLTPLSGISDLLRDFMVHRVRYLKPLMKIQLP